MSEAQFETATPGTQTRHYGMDWLRIAAFFFLVLYHVGLAFGPWDFEIKVAAPRDWVAIPLLAMNAWRLPLLFLVSGFASAALFMKSDAPGRFARDRLLRLGVPLLFAMVVLNTPQPWVALVTQHGYEHGFGWFLANDYFRFQDIDGIKVPTWMHLWFVVYLLVYSLILAALLKWGTAGQAVQRGVERILSGAGLLLIPIGLVFLARDFLPPGWSDTHGLIDDWSAHAVYLPTFLFGFMLHRSPALRAAVGRWWKIGLGAAVAAFALIVLAELRWPGDTPLPEVLHQPYGLARSVQMWGTVIGLIGLADRYLNRDHPRWRPILAEAVFPVYIIHQTIILVVGYWLLPTATGPLARFVILVSVTLGGSFLFYLIGRRIAWLRPLIGLRRIPKLEPRAKVELAV